MCRIVDELLELLRICDWYRSVAAANENMGLCCSVPERPERGVQLCIVTTEADRTIVSNVLEVLHNAIPNGGTHL